MPGPQHPDGIGDKRPEGAQADKEVTVTFFRNTDGAGVPSARVFKRHPRHAARKLHLPGKTC